VVFEEKSSGRISHLGVSAGLAQKRSLLAYVQNEWFAHQKCQHALDAELSISIIIDPKT
jgi:hypothetical protein